MIDDRAFRIKIENSDVFKAFEPHKQRVYMNVSVRARMKDYYAQSQRYGIDYLKGNKNITGSDIKLIESIL